jgi:sugar O-acyltransferase (sialic acid O-acetyltransferase NeuD family)
VRFVLGPWRWMLLVYVCDEDRDRVAAGFDSGSMQQDEVALGSRLSPTVGPDERTFVDRLDLYVIGASGLAREMWWLAQACWQKQWVPRGFADVDPEVSDLPPGLHVVADADLLERHEPLAAVIGIGFPAPRLRVAGRYEAAGHITFPTLVHPSASIDGPVGFGNGVCVTAHCSLTGDIGIGDFVLLNHKVTVGHDAQIGRGSVINPGANISGNVDIGDGVLVGAGATVLQDLAIGAGATVGAGALVTRNVPAGVTVVGIPARPIAPR